MKNYTKAFTRVGTGVLLLTLSGFSTAAIIEPTPIPEPGPMGLLLFGAVALLVSKRFFRNK